MTGTEREGAYFSAAVLRDEILRWVEEAKNKLRWSCRNVARLTNSLPLMHAFVGALINPEGRWLTTTKTRPPLGHWWWNWIFCKRLFDYDLQWLLLLLLTRGTLIFIRFSIQFQKSITACCYLVEHLPSEISSYFVEFITRNKSTVEP